MSVPRSLFGLLLSLVLVSCASRGALSNAARFEYQQPQMGLPFRMVLYAPSQREADAAAALAFRRIARLNDILSDYDTDSELNQLSRSSGQNVDVALSADLWNVLERAQQLAVRSGGAFDVTVGPCVSLWRKARREQKLPDPSKLAGARRAVGFQHVQLDAARRTARLLVPDMRLDLGGIAKGYAIDEAMKVLQQQGIRSALVSGGGDMRVSQPPPGKKGWRIELPALDITNAPPARHLMLVNIALATSGDLFQRLEIEGRRYSHIVDPRTGIGLTDHSLVHVIATDCMTADSLTKVVSVLGWSEGVQILSEHRGVSALAARAPSGRLEIHETAGFSRYSE